MHYTPNAATQSRKIEASFTADGLRTMLVVDRATCAANRPASADGYIKSVDRSGRTIRACRLDTGVGR